MPIVLLRFSDTLVWITFEMAKESEIKILRQYECEVLDVYHKSLPLWQRPRNIAIYGLLIAYESMQTLTGMANTMGNRSVIGDLQFVRTIDDGFSKALKWLCEDNPHIDPLIHKDKEVIIEANEFLRHATHYINIEDFHMMLGRGLADIEVDTSKKIVRFNVLNRDRNESVWHGFAETITNQLKSVNPQQFHKTFTEAVSLISRIEHSIEDRRLVLGSFPADIIPDLRELLSPLMPKETLPLENSCDLNGFNMGEYRKFWTAMALWGFCLVLKQTALVSCGYIFIECNPTQIMKKNLFIERISKIAELSIDTVSSILERMTFGKNSPKLDVLLQPIICGDEKVSWSANLISKCSYERNILRLMSRMDTFREVTATLIGNRERPMLRSIGELLSGRGYAYKLNRTISLNHRTAEIDLLVYNKGKAPKELLLVEGKAVLAADEVNEIAAITKDMIRGQRKLCRSTIILDRIPIDTKKEIYRFVDWPKIEKYYCMVVTPESHPNQLYSHSRIPAVTLSSMRLHLRRRDLDRPSRIWKACKNKEWMSKMDDAVKKRIHVDIPVGDVTYQLPTIVLS